MRKPKKRERALLNKKGEQPYWPEGGLKALASPPPALPVENITKEAQGKGLVKEEERQADPD